MVVSSLNDQVRGSEELQWAFDQSCGRKLSLVFSTDGCGLLWLYWLLLSNQL